MCIMVNNDYSEEECYDKSYYELWYRVSRLDHSDYKQLLKHVEYIPFFIQEGSPILQTTMINAIYVVTFNTTCNYCILKNLLWICKTNQSNQKQMQ